MPRATSRSTSTRSQYFANPQPAPAESQKPPRARSSIPFPPLSAAVFGLIQEKLAHDPFQLLLAVTLLNKTKGTVAIPKFYTLVERYPTPADLAHGNAADVVEIIQSLGLQNSRANSMINLAKIWLERPPRKGWRYRTLNYPVPGAGKGIKPSEVLSDEDERLGAWEIAHLPGCGAYALDSWRIFCRDRLRGLAEGYNGEGAGTMFEPEWKRVVPTDKELRAYLRWMWLKEGWDWDPLTGEKEVASGELLMTVAQGGLSWDCAQDIAEAQESVEHGSALVETAAGMARSSELLV